MDKKKAIHYYELAAMGGDVCARNSLGILEKRNGNMDRALKQFFMSGHAKKDDYEKALRVYQAYLDEIRSDQRDEAAAFSEVEYYEL